MSTPETKRSEEQASAPEPGTRQNPDTSGPNPLGDGRSMVGKTGRDLAEGEYPGLILPSPYFDVLGEPRPWFKMLVYGREGTGKSTFVTGICKAYLPYARHMGAKVLYCSSEEGPSDTSADRIQRLNVRDDNFVVTSFSTVEELKEVAEDLDAQMVVLDSANALKDQSGQGVELMKFCERQGRAITVIAHQNTKGQAAKARGMRHECGIEIQCEQEEWPPGKTRGWGLDIEAPERQGEGGNIIVHVAKTVKNRYGGRVKAAPIPMKEEEIRETVPPEVIDRRVRKLKAHNQWPLTSEMEGHPADAISSGREGTSGQPGRQNRHPGDRSRPEEQGGRRGAHAEQSANGQPDGDSAPTGSGMSAAESDRSGSAPVHGKNAAPAPSPRPNRRPPTDPSSLMGFPSFIRTNPAQKVDLDEFDSFTLRELIENNGNAARSISYLNKFIGWERGCVADVSTNESPEYRTEEGGLLDEPETIEAEDGETVTGKLLSFTYERFPKSTARPDAVAVTRMYLNDKLVDTICADTAKDTIKEIKRKYGDIEIKVMSQEHLQDAFGVEEFRRLASEIPKRQDEDKGTVPSEVRTEGFPGSEVSPRGHINTDVGLVDKRVINIAKEAARGELAGMDEDEGRVISEESLPSSADHGVELLGTEYIFYATDQFELEVSTGNTFFVGSRSTRGDTSLSESLMGFNFGAETNVAEEAAAEEAAEEEPEAEEEEPDLTEEVEEAGPPDVMQNFNQRLEGLSGEVETGFVVMDHINGMPLIDDAAREILVEVADSFDSDTMNEATDYMMQFGDLAVFASESKTAIDADPADQPSFQLRVDDNDEGVDASDLARALKANDLVTQVSGTVSAASLEEEEEPETLDIALSNRAEEALGVDDDLIPGGFGSTRQGIHIGGDALEILQTVADSSSQSSLTFNLAGQTYEFKVQPSRTKFIGSEENGAFRLTADNEAAEDLEARGLIMAFESKGAMRRKAVNEKLGSSEEEEEEPEPEPAPEPSTPEPETEEEGQSAFDETNQMLDEAISTIEDL